MNLTEAPPITITCTGVRKTCPCHACFQARKQYRHEFVHGLRRTIDARPCREHLDALAKVGIGRRTISPVIGVSQLTLLRITNGTRLSVKLETATKILGFSSVDAAAVANNAVVDSTATRLRLQGLRALGYSQEWISHRCGRTNINFGMRDRIMRFRALAVLELCKEIGDTPGPYPRAARWARNRGWRVPADFDEELFYSVEWDGTEPELAFECRSFDYVAEYDFLVGTAPIDVIAERLGITVPYLRVLLSKRTHGITPFGRASETEPHVEMVG